MSTRLRIGILTGGLFVLSILLIGRLFQLTIVEHSSFIAEAKLQQNVQREIQPQRGTIYIQDAASGQLTVAAESVERFSLSLTPRNVQHKAEYAHILAPFSTVPEATILASLQKTGSDGQVVQYMNPIATGLTKDQVTAIVTAVNTLEATLDKASPVQLNFDPAQGDTLYFINGIFFIRDYQRIYPEGPLLGQTLGFVNSGGQGQYGIEGEFDQQLKGYSGQVLIERDSQLKLLSEQEIVDKRDGSNYQLSIDRNIQYEAEQELAQEVQDSEAKSGSVIIMDPKTGEIKAMANYPDYDPNNYASSTPASLFDNPSVSAIWEPGSIFKPLVMAAAIDQGLVTPDTTSTFDESVTVDGNKIETALRHAYGTESMTDVLVNSDNIAMVWVGNKLGNQLLSTYLQKFGFGSATGIDLKNEINGDVPKVSTWRDINRATITFGQGIGITPIQIMQAYSAIANNGVMVKPHVVHAVEQADSSSWQVEQPVFSQQVIKPDTAQQVRDMLVQVVAKNHTKAGVPGYAVGGKTGTAQVPDATNGGYIADAYNHSFIGMGPVSDPKFIMLVKIDQPNIAKVGQYAESTAVPLFGRIAQYLLHYYQIPPTNPVKP